MSGLPEGWELTTLGDCLSSVVGGGTPSRKNPEYFQGDIPWFTVKDMKSLKPNDAKEYISAKAISECATNLIPANTLIIATRIALGKIMRPIVACAINQDLKALFTGTGVNPDFLLYWVISNACDIQEKGSGTTVSGIRLETLNGLFLNLPPSAEQTRIVKKLEELLSDLDAGVAELKAAQKKLGQYRQSLLKAAVEGKLTQHWREQRSALSPSPQPLSHKGRGAFYADGINDAAASYQPHHFEKKATLSEQNPNLRNALPSKPLPSPLAGEGLGERGQEQSAPFETGAELLQRILTERRARWEAKQLAKFKEQGKAPPKDWQSKYPEPVKPDTTDLPELPEGWAWGSLDMVSEIQGGIQKQPSRVPVTNKFPFLRVANVARGRLKLEEIHEIELFSGELDRLALQKGDVLIVEGNGSLTEIGRCALWDGSIPIVVHQNHLIRARPIVMRSEFVETWLNSMRGIERLTALAATSSGLYTLSVGKISKIPVPIPPIDEQTSIVELLFLALEEQKRQESSVQVSLKQSTAQRKNILKAAFSGQLVPQDPNDEAASVLLERIQAERATQQAAKAPKKRTTKTAS